MHVKVLLVPAAFTKVTGEAHWEILLRARAIETQCYVGDSFLTLSYYGFNLIRLPFCFNVEGTTLLYSYQDINDAEY